MKGKWRDLPRVAPRLSRRSVVVSACRFAGVAALAGSQAFISGSGRRLVPAQSISEPPLVHYPLPQDELTELLTMLVNDFAFVLTPA